MSGDMRISDRHLMIKLVAGLAFLGVLAAAGVAYRFGMNGRSEQQPIAVSPVPEVTGGGADSDSFKFSFFDQPHALPELRFVDGQGRSLSLQDFRSRPVLLNIWATWCVPCRKEMPALDRLQAQIGASQLLVLPLSIDRQGIPVVKKFYEELGLTSLGMYVDQSSKASSDLNTVGIPTTLLVDRDGNEVGRKIGPAEWDSPEIVALIRQRLVLPSNEQQRASP